MVGRTAFVHLRVSQDALSMVTEHSVVRASNVALQT